MKHLGIIIMLINSVQSTLAFEIRTEIHIQASPEAVWSILTDFDQYQTWNPFITSIQGSVQTGNRIEAQIDGMRFKPEVLVYKQNEQFEWLGSLLFRGLFDGQHNFEIIDHGDGSCTFIQSESFKGILVPLFRKKLQTDTKAGFEAMNKALKDRAERISNPIY